MVPPPDERILELPDERTDVPLERILELLEERMLELLLERVAELLEERLTEGVVVVRVAVDTLLVVELERTGVATVLLERRVVVDTELPREVVVLVRFVTACEREGVLFTRVVVVLPVVAIRSFVLTLLLPNVRDAVATLRLDTRVVALPLLTLVRDALAVRTATWRSRSNERALLILREALRVANERSGWRVA